MSKYTQVAIPIERLHDLKNMSLEEFVGWIKTVEDRCNAGEGAGNFDHDGKSFLVLTEEEWLACYKNRGDAGKKKSTFDIRKVSLLQLP